MHLPAMIKLRTTAGPATFLATIPETRNIPDPTQDPTPREIRSLVPKTFYNS